jgi:hypothetical protein
VFSVVEDQLFGGRIHGPHGWSLSTEFEDVVSRTPVLQIGCEGPGKISQYAADCKGHYSVTRTKLKRDSWPFRYAWMKGGIMVDEITRQLVRLKATEIQVAPNTESRIRVQPDERFCMLEADGFLAMLKGLPDGIGHEAVREAIHESALHSEDWAIV